MFFFQKHDIILYTAFRRAARTAAGTYTNYKGDISLKKIISAIIASLAASLIFFTGCELPFSLDSDSSDNNGSGAQLSISIESNPENLDPQTASDKESKTIICNIFEGLMKIKENGELSPGAAESYTISDDCLKYTFKLRKDAKWYFDKNDDDYMDDDEYTNVTANDFVFSFRRIYNPETESPYRDYFSCIKNAEKIINGKMNYEEIGVSAPDDYTVVFELEKPNAFFLNMLSSTASMPCNEEFFYSTKGRYGLDDRSINSNGPFFIQQWFYDEYGSNNFMYIRRNSTYRSDETVYPRLITINIKNSSEDVYSDFGNEKSQLLITENSECKYLNKSSYSAVSYESCCVGLIFNTKDKYMQNEDLRKAIRYSVDIYSIEDSVNIAGGIIPPAVTVLGRSYRELSPDSSLIINQDKALAKKHYNLALSKLQTKSLDNLKLLVCSESINCTYLHSFIQQWQEVLGCYVSIDETSKDNFNEKIQSGNYTLALYNLTADENTPEAFFNRFTEENNVFGYKSDELKKLYNEAEKVPNLNNRIEIYPEMEKCIIDSALFYPVFYKPVYLIFPSEYSGFICNPFNMQIYFQYIKKFD